MQVTRADATGCKSDDERSGLQSGRPTRCEPALQVMLVENAVAVSMLAPVGFGIAPARGVLMTEDGSAAMLQLTGFV